MKKSKRKLREKFIIILELSISILLSSCSAQNETVSHEFKIIELKEYYDGKGAIIPATSPQYFTGQINIIKITPTLEEIKRGEYILKENLYCYEKKMLDDGRIYFPQIEKDSFLLFVDDLNNAKNEIKEYYRYYMAYINDKKEKMLIISLFNFSTPEAREGYKNWQDEYISGTGDFFERYHSGYTINLTKGEIDFDKLYH